MFIGLCPSVSCGELIPASIGSPAVSRRAVGAFADPFECVTALLAEHASGLTSLVDVDDDGVNINEGVRFVDEHFQLESEATIRGLKQNIEGRVRDCRWVIGGDNRPCSRLGYGCDYGDRGNVSTKAGENR